MPSRDLEYLFEILEAAEAVADILADSTYDQVLNTRRLRSALMFEMMVIGEASRHLSPELHERHDDIPWSDIVGLRHVIVHGYFTVDWNRLWAVLTNRVPVLREQVRNILNDEFPSVSLHRPDDS